MDAALIVGYAASLCSTTSFLPQAWKIIRTGDTGAISKRMYAVTVTGFALWSVFGVMRMEMAYHPYQHCVLLPFGLHPCHDGPAATNAREGCRQAGSRAVVRHRSIAT